MHVVVVGGGFGGMAASARLAKLGHRVTLLERDDRLGGCLGTLAEGGYEWQTGPTYTLLPAVLRDLFRKSGRPLEREIGLEWLDVVREHRFDDGSALRLPGGSRADQLAAGEELGTGLGEQWCGFVDGFEPEWEAVRRHYLERPWNPGVTERDVRRLVFTRETLHRRVHKRLDDPRLRLAALYDATAGGHDPRNVPAWMGATSYLEQRFGAWRIAPTDGGMAALADVLTARLATRRVEVHTGAEVLDLVLAGDRVAGVRTADGVIDADAVVCAVDPRRLPALAASVRRTMPAIPPVVCHLGLAGEVPDLPHEVVLHGEVTLTVRTAGRAPEGGAAWTVLARGRLAEDVPTALARLGLDVREQIEVQVDRSPRELVERFGGSPYGVLWQGRETIRRRLGPTTPVPGVYAAGAHATPGAGLPFAGLSAALVAESIGS